MDPIKWLLLLAFLCDGPALITLVWLGWHHYYHLQKISHE